MPGYYLAKRLLCCGSRHGYLGGGQLSKANEVLKRFRKGHTLTSQQAWAWWGITRLAVVVNHIREKYGEEAVYTEIVDAGQGTTHGKYHPRTDLLK